MHFIQTGKESVFVLEFPGGKVISCNLNVPYLPCNSRYRGTLIDAQKYLINIRPSGWLKQLEMLQFKRGEISNTQVIGPSDLQIGLRHISREVVFPEQVEDHFDKSKCLHIKIYSFHGGPTLRGMKRKIYALLKVIKYITSSSTPDKKMKFAVFETFQHKNPEEVDIGAGLKKVLEHYMIRYSFDSLNKHLKNLGIEILVLCQDGVKFVGKFEDI